MSPSRPTSCCTFTFSDGRRCRTPRQPGHPLFCCFHARKFEQSHTADQLGREIAHVFSRDYLSACDLNAALARLFTATARGHVPPKTTRTLAYLAQVMVQTLRLAEHEYTESFSPDTWRRTVRSSIHSNSASLHPVPVVAGLQTGSSPSPSVAAGLQTRPAPSSAPLPQKAHSALSAPPPDHPAAPRDPRRAAVPGNAILQNGVATVATLKSQLKQLLASELALPPQPPVVPSPAPISEKPKLEELELKLDPVAPPQQSTGAANFQPSTLNSPALSAGFHGSRITGHETRIITTPSAPPPNDNEDAAGDRDDCDDTGDDFESYALTPAMRRRQWRERV